MSKTNLLDETKKALLEANKSEADVRFVHFGKMPFYCSWFDFVTAAARFDYDNGYGGAEVDVGLRIVGDDWWLERGEYDGSEWWEFKTLPTRPEKQRTPEPDDLKDNW